MKVRLRLSDLQGKFYQSKGGGTTWDNWDFPNHFFAICRLFIALILELLE